MAATNDSQRGQDRDTEWPERQVRVSEFVRDLCTTNDGRVDAEALERLTGQRA